MDNLLLIPLDDPVVFLGMRVTLGLEVGNEERVLRPPQGRGLRRRRHGGRGLRARSPTGGSVGA